VGVPALLVSFAINPGPPPVPSVAQTVAFGAQHHAAVTTGGCLKMTGTLLAAVLALALVQMAEEGRRLAGALTPGGPARPGRRSPTLSRPG
jgi:hypothetical protein